MKKSLIALAVLVASGAAMAQSSVTLYGLVDLNLTSYSAGDSSKGVSQWKMMDGAANGLNGSRWGIRTNEDLGGGMYAGVQMESGVSADTGNAAQGGRAFGRQNYVKLGSQSAGELRLGRQYDLADSLIGMNNSVAFGNASLYNPTTGVTNVGKALNTMFDAPRSDNVIQYETPDFAGFKVAVQYAPGEGTADNFTSLRGVYARGPVYVGGVYSWNKDRTTGDDTNKVTSITANYNFGAFTLMGGLQNATNLTTTSGNGTVAGSGLMTVTGDTSLGTNTSFAESKFSGYTIGVEMPVGSATTVGANYYLGKYESAAGANANLGKFALSGKYALSKVTFLYAAASFATGDLKNYITEKNVFQLGLRTAF